MKSQKQTLTLAIEGSSKTLSIVLINNLKTFKIARYNLVEHNFSSDLYIKHIEEFINNDFLIDTFFVGCGPGSFTNLRKCIAFSKAYLFCNDNIKFLGINSLASIAFKNVKNTKKLDKKYILSAIDTQCNDYYCQLFSITNDYHDLPLLPLSKIEIITNENYEKFLDKYLVKKSETNIIGIRNIQNLSDLKENSTNLNLDLSLAEDIATIGNLLNKNLGNYQFLKEMDFYNEDLKPIYGRKPNTF